MQLADTAVLMFTSCHTVSSGFSSRVGAQRFLHSGTMSGCSSPKRKQLPREFSHDEACGGFLSNKVVVSGKWYLSPGGRILCISTDLSV